MTATTPETMATATPAASSTPARRGRVRAFIARQPKQLTIGVIMLTPFLIVSIAPSILARYGALSIEGKPLMGPSSKFWLGTDEVGRDLFSRCLAAARTDILTSLSSAFVAFSLGTALGLFAGYVGGITDTITMRLVDVFLSFPTIILALFLIVIFGRGQWVQILAIALVMMPSMARFSRGAGLVLRNRGYVEASRISGASTIHILRRHVLPNSLPTLLVAASVLASSAVLISASLSYLGLGTQPPDPSWGNMLRSAYGSVYQAPLYGVGPGICITIVAGAYLLIGEGFRRKYSGDRNLRNIDTTSLGGV